MRGSLLYVLVPLIVVVGIIAYFLLRATGEGVPDFITHPTIGTYFIAFTVIIFMIFLAATLGRAEPA